MALEYPMKRVLEGSLSSSSSLFLSQKGYRKKHTVFYARLDHFSRAGLEIPSKMQTQATKHKLPVSKEEWLKLCVSLIIFSQVMLLGAMILQVANVPAFPFSMTEILHVSLRQFNLSLKLWCILLSIRRIDYVYNEWLWVCQKFKIPYTYCMINIFWGFVFRKKKKKNRVYQIWEY